MITIDFSEMLSFFLPSIYLLLTVVKMPKGFDLIAPYYDSLARLVFGDSIRHCQLEYLDKIPPGAQVLILGGGTGWLLGELMKINPSCRVWYLESSIKMLEMTKGKVRCIEFGNYFYSWH